MDITALLNVGPQAVRAAEGSGLDFRCGVTGDAIASQLNPRYCELTYRGYVFTACNTASQALSLNSTTATGLILTNPAGSSKNIELLEVCVALTTAPAGAAPLILTGNLDITKAAVTHSTPLVIQNAYLGIPANTVAKADSAATIPNATIMRAIGGGPVATGSVHTAFIKDDLGGAIVLVPNTCISLQCLTTAISVVASFTWAEIPQ